MACDLCGKVTDDDLFAVRPEFQTETCKRICRSCKTKADEHHILLATRAFNQTKEGMKEYFFLGQQKACKERHHWWNELG